MSSTTVVKTIRFPAPLWQALEARAEVQKTSTPDLIRQMLGEQLNSEGLEARLVARLERQEKILLSIIAALNEDEDADALNEGKGGDK